MDAMRDRVVAITGASSGIGAATAVELARRGARLVLGARRVDKLNAVAERCRQHGAIVFAIPCDVARRQDCDQLVAETVARFGRLDVMMANAGYGFLARIVDVTDAQFDDIVATNVKGTLYCMQAAAAVMLKQAPLPERPPRAARGHIVVTSSGAARRGLPLYGVYAMTKAAQLSLCEAMRVEMHGTGIYVSSVHPLTTATEFFEVASSKSRVKSLGLTHVKPAEAVARGIVGLMVRPRPEYWPVFASRWALSMAGFLPGITDSSMRRAEARRIRT
jgi:NAD(P)-dependent dehydrogenase (short-subunit alcohol dehydrogenase family)